LFCPHFSGRVLPEDSSLKGSFMGLDFRHTRAHFYRAIMEGISYEYSYYLSIIKENYPNGDFGNMYTIGGGANSKLFNQIKADVLNVSVYTFESGETALIGSAVIAAVGAKVFDDYKEPIRKLMKKKGEFKPEPCNASVYISQSEVYGRMLNMTSQFYKQYSL
jgi:Sugar (pentulose and hexulose) kinases